MEDILREHSSHSNSAEQLATYCACLKRELIEAVQHVNDLMQLSSKMRYENSVYAAKLKFYEDAMEIPNSEFKKSKMAKPVKQVSSTLVAGGNFLSATSSTSTDYVEEICLSPLSVTFNRNSFNLRIGTPNDACKSGSSSQTDLKHENKSSVAITKTENADSVIKILYNGLERHDKMTHSPGLKKIRIGKQT